jgi:hypothetical protein
MLPAAVAPTPGVLDLVLDVAAMSGRLAPFLGVDGRVVAARVIDQTHAERSVVAYEVEGGSGGPRTTLIGKVYADGERAARLSAVLGELHALDLLDRRCGVPTPVAHLGDLGMSLFAASPGVPLDALDGHDRRAGVVASARWLAALHGSSLVLDRRLDLAREVANMALWAQVVTGRHPAARAVTTRLLERLVRLAGQTAVSADVPIHKDFHYGHTLFDHGRLTVIDLDEARYGDRAFDVAHYLANLRLLALRERMGCLDLTSLESAFLATYASLTGYQPDVRHAFFYAYTCLKIAKQLARGRGPEPAPTGAARGHQVQRILHKGLRCLVG